MPIIRTYACEDCFHLMDVTLSMDQVDDPPPPCPMCAQRPMRQEFKPVSLGGSATSRAHAIAEDIAANDYHVSDMNVGRKQGERTQARYKDTTANVAPSQWSAAQETLQQAVVMGRQTRLKYGSGLDVLQSTLKSGDLPDLIEVSKRRMIKVW
jgi:hypothetical protein